MSRFYGAGTRETMRPGLISLVTLVVVISLATAAVLTIATSHAMAALSQRQAAMTSEGYLAEKSAQTALALVDNQIQASKTQNPARLAAAIDAQLDEILSQACADGVTATHKVEGDAIMCTFVTEGGRMLQTQVVVGSNKTYDVVSWKLTASPQEDVSDDTLWSGPAANE